MKRFSFLFKALEILRKVYFSCADIRNINIDKVKILLDFSNNTLFQGDFFLKNKFFLKKL